MHQDAASDTDTARDLFGGEEREQRACQALQVLRVLVMLAMAMPARLALLLLARPQCPHGFICNVMKRADDPLPPPALPLLPSRPPVLSVAWPPAIAPRTMSVCAVMVCCCSTFMPLVLMSRPCWRAGVLSLSRLTHVALLRSKSKSSAPGSQHAVCSVLESLAPPAVLPCCCAQALVKRTCRLPHCQPQPDGGPELELAWCSTATRRRWRPGQRSWAMV
jgi:hypothetical protein